MIKQTIEISLKHRWIVMAFFGLFMAFGVWCYLQLKIEAYPDIADTNVIVITKFEGRAAEEVEQKITIPIERALNSVPSVLARRSRTIFGLSVVQLNFDDDVEDDFARQQVFQKLQDAELPDGVKPQLAPLTSAIGEIFRYVIEAPSTYSPMDLRVLQDWVIIPKLLQAKGVADVSTFGGPIKQFHILTSPTNLRKYNLQLQDVIDAVNKNNQNTGGNIILRGGQGFAVRGIGIIRDIEDIENIVLTTSNGVPVFVKNVATVEINPPQPSGILGFTTTDDSTDVSLATEGVVLMRRHENPSEVLKSVKQKLKELEEDDLPKDVKINIMYDRSFLIDHSLETVGHTLLEGITIAIVVIFLFLGSFRSALVVAVTIPFSLLFAFIMMWLTDIPANLLSLGAIDFGIIVDGAGRMAENIIRRLETADEREKKKGFMFICTSGALEVAKEIFFCVAIIILAYLPIFTMQRVEGKLFSPMALTLTFALVGSMLCALTVIPVLISFAFSKVLEKKHADKPLLSWFRPLYHIQNIYQVSLDRLLDFPRIAVMVFAVVFIFGASLAIKLGTEFLPRLDEGSIWMRCILPSGTNVEETARLAPEIRKIISKYYPVENIVTQSGRNDDGTDPITSNRMEIMVTLKEYKLWSDTLSKTELIHEIQGGLERHLPGAYISVGQPIIDQVMEIVTGSAADLAVSVVGDDFSLLRLKADSILAIVKKTKGSVANSIEQEGQQAQIGVEIDRKKAARYGINVSDIQAMIEAAIGGKTINYLYEGSRRYDIVVRYYPENRGTIEAVKILQIPSANGSYVPLKELAQIKYVDGQTNIYRLDGKRMSTVRTNIAGRDQGGYVGELVQKIRDNIQLPEGYKIIYGGQFENLERAGKQLSFAIPLTLFIVFVVLFILFGNFRDTLVVFACIPIGLSGGALALLFRSYNFNVSAGVGFISLFGIAAMTGIMSVSFLNNAVKKLHTDRINEGFLKLDADELKLLIVNICREQLRPQMMVIIVAMLALIPAATSSGIGSDVQRPLATVIIGGLLYTLIFTPFIIPVLYWLIERRRLCEAVEKK